MPFTNEKQIREEEQRLRKEAAEQRKSIEELKLGTVKLGIHATERVLTTLIEKSFAYQEKVDTLLIQAVGAENGDRFIALAEMQMKLAKQMLDMANGLFTKLIEVEAARQGLTFKQ